jgi:predicted O-methyltransferase YrrM
MRPVRLGFWVVSACRPQMLEIGTGTGIGTSWLLDGMYAEAQLTTVDINPEIQAIAQKHLQLSRLFAASI